ncbi:hypothetical protein KR054_005979 [Drosophila jambulina]|nr:hypothetical protein KR054_005979 [Drosophila jambulina]
MPFSFKTLHMPCEFDICFWNPSYMTANCQWIFNLRFQTENYFRSYMLYKLESFFFGQYAIRIRRYELDPHAYKVD